MKQASSPAGEIMTPAQVAAYLQVHKLTVYRYIRNRELPAVRLGRALRILKVDVDEFLRLHQVADRSSSRGLARRSSSRHVAPRAQPKRGGRPPEPLTVPPAEARPAREDLVMWNPLDWLARGLH